MARILVLHGPNLNLLGEREPGIYGSTSLETINARLTNIGAAAGCALECFQSNSEAELIDKIHSARKPQDPKDPTSRVAFIIINPAAFTHTSIALRDALAATGLPFVEVHLSNVHAREAFRQHSYFSEVAAGVICGLGPAGYEYALQFALEQISHNKTSTMTSLTT